MHPYQPIIIVTKHHIYQIAMEKINQNVEIDLELLAWQMLCQSGAATGIAVVASLTTKVVVKRDPLPEPVAITERSFALSPVVAKVVVKRDPLPGTGTITAPSFGVSAVVKGLHKAQTLISNEVAKHHPTTPAKGAAFHHSLAIPLEAALCFKIGFPFLRDHLDELLAAGWTRRGLFGRGRYSWPYGYEWGAAWADSWQDEGKIPSVGDHGQIVFSFTAGKQSIWPGHGGMNFDVKTGRFIITKHEDGKELIQFEQLEQTNQTAKEVRQ